MKLGQIVKMVMTQAGEDVEDTEEYREQIIIYVNEGLRRMHERYKPTRTATLYPDEDGKISIAGIKGMDRITMVTTQDGRECRWEAAGEGKIAAGVGDGEGVKIRYTFEAPEMLEETDEPELPQGAHMALADYATWRFYGNGNLAKQQRGEFYYRRFLMELEKITPKGLRGAGPPNFHGLYECT